jgi:hypothetical protein
LEERNKVGHLLFVGVRMSNKIRTSFMSNAAIKESVLQRAYQFLEWQPTPVNKPSYPSAVGKTPAQTAFSRNAYDRMTSPTKYAGESSSPSPTPNPTVTADRMRTGAEVGGPIKAY